MEKEGPQIGKGEPSNRTRIAQSCSDLPLMWKIMFVLAFVLIIILTVTLIVISAKLPTKNERSQGFTGKALDDCSSPYKQDTTLPKEPGVFQALSKSELHAVRDYMLSQKDLNITPVSNARVNCNFIFLIELYLPKKSDVLEHLDKNTQKPVRKARVVVINGGNQKPSVEEYIVEPLPKPSKHSPLRMSGRTYPVPFASRPFTDIEENEIEKYVVNITLQSYSILKESFGLWYNNCTDNTCLTYAVDGMPASKQQGERRSWVMLFRNRIGYDLLPLPFQFQIDHADRDSKKWKILDVHYNNQLFSSVTELVQKYKNNLINKTIFIPSEQDELRATFKRRGTPFLSKPMRPPTVVEPNGKRFGVKGRQITYMGWQFDVAARSIGGPALFDVKFNGTRIIYEIGLHEAASFYSANDPKQSSSSYLDSNYGLGSTNEELLKGVDCPGNAVYLDSTHFVNTNSAFTNPNSICIFELHTGLPLRRHRSVNYDTDSIFFIGSMADHVLVVRSILVPENYDYIVDYILHQNGVIEVRVSTAGYLITTTYYAGKEDLFGFQNFPRTLSTIHDHFALFKVDLDVGGVKNRYQTLDVVVKNMTCDWDPSGYLLKKTIQRSMKKNESEALLHYNFDQPKLLIFYNEKNKNRYNNPKGYRIQPMYMAKQIFPDDYFVSRGSAWTKYQLVVTKQKDTERYGSCIFNQYGMQTPVFNFDSYINDDDNIVDEDLVAWVPVGGLHIPNTEDVPSTLTTGNTFTFFIRPFGYFDEDPTMSSTDGVLVTPKSTGGNLVETYGTPEDGSCHIPKRKISYGEKQ